MHLCKFKQLTFTEGDQTLRGWDKMLVTSIFTYFHDFKVYNSIRVNKKSMSLYELSITLQSQDAVYK